MLANKRENCKVVELNNMDSVQVAINEFFRHRQKRSKQTLNNYKIRIEDFFQITVRKSINDVTQGCPWKTEKNWLFLIFLSWCCNFLITKGITSFDAMAFYIYAKKRIFLRLNS